jgi:hypothetical protein
MVAGATHTFDSLPHVECVCGLLCEFLGGTLRG